MSINKNILRCYIIWLLTGASEEVLQHPRITFYCSMRARPLFLLGKKSIERSLPAGYGVSLPVSLLAGLAFIISMTGALLLGCAIANILAISALWTIAADGVQRLLPAFVMIFSGNIIPLAFFPNWAQPVLRLLPFSGLADIPFRFYIGALPPSDILPFFLLQMLWTFIIIGLGYWLVAAATRRVVVQGG